MIFVTLGTHELTFNRLLDYIEKLDIQEEVIIQSGNTKFKSKKYKVIPFMDAKEFDRVMDECDLIVCHGGVGSILSGLKKDKKVIAVPRLSKYSEHNDDHQLEITYKLDKEGYIINCLDYDQFKDATANYRDKKLKKYEFGVDKLVNFVDDYIKKL